MGPVVAFTFTEQLVLNVGTAIVGTLVLGALVSWIA
jgi:low affinity Fe/Cu permease